MDLSPCMEGQDIRFSSKMQHSDTMKLGYVRERGNGGLQTRNGRRVGRKSLHSSTSSSLQTLMANERLRATKCGAQPSMTAVIFPTLPSYPQRLWCSWHAGDNMPIRVQHLKSRSANCASVTWWRLVVVGGANINHHTLNFQWSKMHTG